MNRGFSRLLVSAVLVLGARPVGAQQVSARFASVSEPAAHADLMTRGRSAVWYAKWGILLASAGAGVYGFLVNNDAEDRYESLERLCRAEIERCTDRLPSGAFADQELENRYQEVLDLDRSARIALLASQVGVVSSVVLFILDLRDGGSPPNIPYEPQRISVFPGAGGRTIVQLRWPVD